MAKWMARARGASLLIAGAGLVVAAGLTAPAIAQQKPPAAAAPKAAAAGPTPSQSAWVKLCEKAQYAKVGADGKPTMGADNKPVMEDKSMCLTHHEQMTAAGMTLVSAAIQQLEGVPQMGMMLMVPPAVGLTIPAGMKAVVYTKEQWAKVQKKEQIDEKDLIGQTLVFTMCHQNGCTAENEATPQLLEAMKKGAVMVAYARHPSGRPVAFEVPLNGFDATLSGAPVQNEIYKAQREKLWEQIRANQLQQMKSFQTQLESGGPAPGAAAGAPAAAQPKAAPAKK